jgi:hypothetical protein
MFNEVSNSVYHKKWLIFLSLTLMSCIMAYFTTNYIITIDVYHTSFSDTLTSDRIAELLNNNKKWVWISYLVIPIFLLIKFFLVSITLIIGSVFFDYKLSFKRAFLIVMWAESIFIIMAFIKLLFLWFNRNSLSLEYLNFFTPLSVINFFNVGDLEKWYIYPLQTINVFEIIYCFFLAHLLKIEIQKEFWKSFEYILFTYVAGLLIWVVFITFLTLNLL